MCLLANLNHQLQVSNLPLLWNYTTLLEHFLNELTRLLRQLADPAERSAYVKTSADKSGAAEFPPTSSSSSNPSGLMSLRDERLMIL